MANNFRFSNEGREYEINNDNYKRKASGYFEVKICPKCGKINSVYSNGCKNCGKRLTIDAICIATRGKRDWAGFIVGAAIHALISVSISYFGNIRLGAIPTALMLTICMAIGFLLSYGRIKIDQRATEDYKSFMVKTLINSSEIITDNDTIKSFAMTKQCNKCGENTEQDSQFCSWCGERVL